MIIDRKSLVLSIVLVLVTIALIMPGIAGSDDKKDTPESRMIENAIDKMDKIKSAKLNVGGYLHPKEDKKIEFEFDGVLEFPGNLQGSVVIEGKDFRLKGKLVSIDGNAWFFNPIEDKWEKGDPNEFHVKKENPLYSIPPVLWMLSFFPEYLDGGLRKSDGYINGSLATCFTFNLNLDALHEDANRGDQPDELIFLASALTGDDAIARLWVDNNTGYLAGLDLIVDEFVESKNPFGVEIRLSDYNIDVEIEKPSGVN